MNTSPKLPLQHSVSDAISIYGRRLSYFIAVIFGNLLVFWLILLISNSSKVNFHYFLTDIVSIPSLIVIVIGIVMFFGIAWWLRITIAQERKRDMDEIRNEVTGVIGPALDRIVRILELQDQINKDLRNQTKVSRALSDKSEDSDSS